jgi:hypothetical protein
MKKVPWKTALLSAGAILLGIVAGQFAASPASGLQAIAGQPVVAQAAQAVPVAALAPDSPDTVYICTPAYIGVFPARVHVRCTVAASGGIYYFAASTSDQRNADRVLSVMLTAKALGKNLQIYYNPSASGASFGCQTHDCRPIDAIEMTN